ncbi:hypothetical protein LINPERPRIM_LOCUS9722 [Linum perenne]
MNSIGAKPVSSYVTTIYVGFAEGERTNLWVDGNEERNFYRPKLRSIQKIRAYEQKLPSLTWILEKHAKDESNKTEGKLLIKISS